MKELLSKLFTSKTKSGRILRTALQAFIGLSGSFVVILAIPEVQAYVESLPLVIQLGGLSIVVAGISAAQNYAKDMWEYVKINKV